MTQKEKETLQNRLDNATVNISILFNAVTYYLRQSDCCEDSLCALEVLHEVARDYMDYKIDEILTDALMDTPADQRKTTNGKD